MKPNIVQIALDLPIEKSFDFLAPDATQNDVGRMAVVPFGNKLLSGVVIGLSTTTDVPVDKLRAIKFIQRALPKFSAHDIALMRFCQGYYHHPFGAIAMNGLPPAMRATRLFVPKADLGIVITTAGRDALHTLPARAVAQRALLEAINAASRSEILLKSEHERAGPMLRAFTTNIIM